MTRFAVAFMVLATLELLFVSADVLVDVKSLRFPESTEVGFRRVTDLETALSFTNHLSSSAETRNRILENGSGVALGDVNGDGRVDLYLARLEGANLLVLNLGDWRFEIVPDAGGAACEAQSSSGVLLFDSDGDRDLDLIVSAVDHATRLFENDGSGKFEEVESSGLPEQPGGTSIAASDVDRDGDLDLYLAYYRDRTVKDQDLKLDLRREDGLWVLPPDQTDRFISTRNLTSRGILLEQGLPDLLCLSDGQGRYSAVLWTEGFFRDEMGDPLSVVPRDWSLSVSFADANDDGFPDFYVCSDFISPDRFWMNQSGKGFQAVNRAALTFSSWSSMCLDWADADHDGDLDFFVGDMLSRDHQRRHYQRANHTPNAWTDWAFAQRRQYMRNTFFANRGNGSFAELARFAGLAATEWTWNCAWLDVDRDGWQDLLITNGHPHDSLDSDGAREIGGATASDPGARLRLPSLDTENLIFRNESGLRFEELGAQWGFDSRTHGQGLALGDLDGDGDQDLVVNPLNASVEIYENIGSSPIVTVALEDHRLSATPIGAKVVLTSNDSRQMRELRAGGRYLSSDAGVLSFGVANCKEPLRIEVRWPDGEVSTVEGVAFNSAITLTRRGEHGAHSDAMSRRIVEKVPAFFNDVSDEVSLVHRDRNFNDDQLQQGLPHQFSRLGIGMGIVDLDDNGWDDLILGSGNGGMASVFLNDPARGWEAHAGLNQQEQEWGDVVGVVGVGGGRMILAHSGYEAVDRLSRLRVVDRQSPSEKAYSLERLEGVALGGLACGDVDQDGDLDLFVGSRFKSGKYPQSAASLMIRNEGGEFVVDDELSRPFTLAGRVTSALFCHVNDDHWIDLVVAREWGSIGIFINNQGQFVDASARYGVEALTGLWQAIDCGDFNGDGRLDLVVGNWGVNRLPRPDDTHALRLYHGAANGGRAYLALEAYFSPALDDYVPHVNRDRVHESLPQLASWFPTYRSYGATPMIDLAERLFDSYEYAEVATLASGVFMNQGESFEFKPLPAMVQHSVVMGISVADWDGDGAEDIFVSHNLYETHLEEAPYDAGVGVWVRGDGKAGFQAVDTKDSGLSVFGAGRAAAIGDWNHDGRWDLFVARQGRTARLYENRDGKPGVRVALNGVDANPAAVGAVLRLQGEGKTGPARQIIGGGGDGGQDTFSPLLFVDEGLDQLWVRWPDGHETTTVLPSRARSINVSQSGETVEWSR